MSHASSSPIWQTPLFLSAPIQRLYIMDYGLFQVHENGRIIGIQGYLLHTSDDRHILVDTGFPAKYAADTATAAAEDNLGIFGDVLQLTDENLPAGQLAKIGLAPTDIDVLVMTHTDIDHVGGLGDFPKIPIYIGRADRAQPNPRYFGSHTTIPMEWPDANYQIVDQDMVLCPGVALLESAGHAPGHLSLLVNLASTGTVLLTGDAISRPAEITERFASAWDPEFAIRSATRLMSIADDTDAMVVYGHDPQQWGELRKIPQFYD